MVAPVAKLTTESAVHELWYTPAGYVLQTTVDGSLVSERHLGLREAMKWIGLTKQCGGVVYEREVAHG